jgi:hypothetical protein
VEGAFVYKKPMCHLTGLGRALIELLIEWFSTHFFFQVCNF